MSRLGAGNGPALRLRGVKMLEGKSSPAGSGHRAAGDSYPGDLALFVPDRWRDVPDPTSDGADPLPEAAALEGLQRLAFPHSLPFGPRELRRLSVAADPQRTLIGVRPDGEGGLRIWGLINSGTRWLRDVYGGRRAGAPLPQAPVVHVAAPGSIEAYKGHELVGKLQRGRLSGSRLNPFESQWLPGEFSRLLREFTERHEAARNRARELSGERWAPLEPTLRRRITERMMKRVISVLRDARHGGTVIFVPTENAEGPFTERPLIDLRYPFADDQSRQSFPDIIVG